MDYREAVILSQKDLNILNIDDGFITVLAKYGPSKVTKIPLFLNPEIAFFSASIIGDGHLRKSKLQIDFEVGNKNLILQLIDICERNFNRIFNLKSRIVAGKKFYHVFIDSKAIYNFLRYVFEIPPGKKSHLVKVPDFIKFSSNEIKDAFLKGIMATEGGRRKRGYGLSTASRVLWSDLAELFKDVGINTLKDKWTHQTYKKEYYGLSFKEQD